MHAEAAARVLAGEPVRLEDGGVGVVAAVGELGGGERVEAARALEVADGAPDRPVDVAPRRQLVARLQQPLGHVPRRVRLVRVRETTVPVDRHSACRRHKQSAFSYPRTLTTWHRPHSSAAAAAIDRYLLLPPGPQQQTLSGGFAAVGSCRDTDGGVA